jgi:hypothetical protein
VTTPLVAPCAWTLNEVCCDTWSDYSDTLKTQATSYASLVLWAATGRQYGLCDVTVRPCGRECSGCANGYYWSGGTWIPYIWNGQWFNCWCGTGNFGCCSCDPACRVYLPGPVNSVTEVIVDGSTIDPSGYKVYDNRWLVRLDTATCWPYCADFNVTSGTGFFQVKYLRGTAVPDALLTAAGTLACEYAKACLGQVCRLPSRVVSVARQGVTVSMVDVDQLLTKGLTGLTEVDQVIVSLNPYGLKQRTRFYSPDVPIVRMVTS